jgi:hypothetical protein
MSHRTHRRQHAKRRKSQDEAMALAAKELRRVADELDELAERPPLGKLTK